ncbi:uncharacterized protein LOC110737569 [Chenopodium quinoa]|uniref:uncharacterized protein LOC110737569 n=1 Tax=Chenopodium quinoa TaxID=63459 RepID=UPI000B76DFCD|nr:uncharacterized protein LOC110737569 [Chenopodium quinoa]
MEYLRRLLRKVAEDSQFRFHSRCQTLKLNYLVFTDDLIMFNNGDFNSVQLLLRTLATFAATSGLVANEGKSNMYCCNIGKEKKERMLQNYGFCEGKLPFRYLGVNVSSKKLFRDDFKCLIDKITTRIRSWGCRSLSYAGRTQLVNYVLMSLHIYWANIFIIPKVVLDGVSAICINYLWEGRAVYTRAPPIALDIVCRCKNQGGLGVQNCHTCNIAAIGKQI